MIQKRKIAFSKDQRSAKIENGENLKRQKAESQHRRLTKRVDDRVANTWKRKKKMPTNQEEKTSNARDASSRERGTLGVGGVKAEGSGWQGRTGNPARRVRRKKKSHDVRGKRTL